MNNIGPPLEALTHRLAETPLDILHAKFKFSVSDPGNVSVTALISDFFVDRGFAPRLMLVPAQPPQLLLSLISLWLMRDPHFQTLDLTEPLLTSLFDERLAELSGVCAPAKFVDEPDQREELVRSILAHFNYRPEGETLSQAKDRLSSLSSTERQRLIRESRAAEKRAREIREALAKKAAEESADKWTRE